MNKHTLLLGLLGKSVLETHSNIVGSNAHVRLTEEELDKVEIALKANDVSDLNKTIADQKEKISNHEKLDGEMKEALTAAFSVNKLDMGTMSAAEAIAHLSTKCKEYGESTNTHSFTKTDGKDNPSGMVDGYIDPNAEHNKIIAKVFNR